LQIQHNGKLKQKISETVVKHKFKLFTSTEQFGTGRNKRVLGVGTGSLNP